MEQKNNQQMIAFELQMKFQAKTFRLSLSTKKGAIIFAIVALGKLLFGYLRSGFF
jgi:hypothetical protein